MYMIIREAALGADLLWIFKAASLILNDFIYMLKFKTKKKAKPQTTRATVLQ